MSVTAMVGVDVSKDTLNWAWMEAGSKDPVREGKVANSVAGVREIQRLTPLDAPLVVEPTGRYSRCVVQAAQGLLRTVLLAPPMEAKRFLQSLNARAKTDKIDGKGLARFGLSRPLQPYTLKAEALERVGQLLSARKGISRAMASLRQQRTELPYAREVLTSALASLQTDFDALDKQLAECVRTLPEMASARALAAVPGIGPITSASAAACLEGKRFAHPDQAVAYVGLDVRIHQSGRRSGELGLTKHGDGELRRLFYLAAQASLRAKDGPFVAQYEREQAKGLSKTAALCAIARKMVRLCWSIHKHGTQYDPSRLYNQPPRHPASPSCEAGPLQTPGDAPA